MHDAAHDRLRLRLAVAIIAAGMVAGCESLFGPSSAPEAPPPPPPPAPRAAIPPPPPPAPSPRGEIKVVGLSEDEVQALLGPPTSAADQPPAKVWQYRAGNCAVEVYFYLDVGRNAFYALHYDSPAPTSSGAPVTATANAHDAADRCLNRVYNAHRDH